jgi:hypothetical protein
MKSQRIYLVAPDWLKKAMLKISESKGITLSEYIKDTMKQAVEKENKQKTDAS